MLDSPGGLYPVGVREGHLERLSIECRRQLGNCFGFALLRSVIGLNYKNFAPLFQPITGVKPKPIVVCAPTFSRALCRPRVITSSFDLFLGLSPSFVIGQSNYFGFAFTTLK